MGEILSGVSSSEFMLEAIIFLLRCMREKSETPTKARRPDAPAIVERIFGTCAGKIIDQSEAKATKNDKWSRLHAARALRYETLSA